MNRMKSQEKKPVDDSLSGTESGSSDPPSELPWAVKKVKLPEFSGFDPQSWIQKANLYFDINNALMTSVCTSLN
ncbi:hypothetical protein R6Q59_033260 [Mikania micrantha]